MQIGKEAPQASRKNNAETSAQDINTVSSVQEKAYMTSKEECKALLNSLTTNSSNIQKELKFAYFLWFYNLIHRSNNQVHPNGIVYNAGVNFCNKVSQNAFDVSCLNSICRKRLFNKETDFSFFVRTDYYTMVCDSCELKNQKGEMPQVCPYNLCGMIMEACYVLGKSPEECFSSLLNSNKPTFFNVINDNISVSSNNRLDASSPLNSYASDDVLAAAFLFEADLFRVTRIEKDTVCYNFYPLCLSSSAQGNISPMLNFWKSPLGSRKEYTWNYDTNQNLRSGESCKNCKHNNCPDKIAAEIALNVLESFDQNSDESFQQACAQEAYELAQNITTQSLSLREDYQYNRFISAIWNIPMTKESRNTCLRILPYIINKFKNPKVPSVSMNIVLLSSDEKIADEFAQQYNNLLCFYNYLPNSTIKEISMAKTSFSELIALYENAELGTIFKITQFELIEKDPDFSNGIHKLVKIMDERKASTVTVIYGEKTQLHTFFEKYSLLGKKIFSKRIEILDMDEDSVYSETVHILNRDFELSEEFKNALKEYICYNYPSSELKSKNYIDDLCEKIIYNHYSVSVNIDNKLNDFDVPKFRKPRAESDIFKELDSLVGLYEVKSTLRDLMHLVKFNLKLKKSPDAQGLHMVFSGAAGTGKTTVARLLAEILHSIGFIKQNKCVVCSSQDLIAGYIGQTAIKTTEVCESAYDGILFIDEAYLLNPNTGYGTDTFKEECVGTLIQQMENNRDRLIVVFAGYTKEMNTFINNSNSGLASRIFKTIEFPNYSPEELLVIFEDMLAKSGFKIDDLARQKALNIITSTMNTEKNFGNARFARNLFEQSKINHARNVNLNDSEEQLLTFTERDICI